MIPVRLLVAGPFGVVEVGLLLGLEVATLSRCILIYRLIKAFLPITAIVEIVLNIIGLPSNGIGQHLVSLLDFLEHVRGLVSLLLGHALPLEEIRVVLLRHLVVRLFNVLLLRAWLHHQDRVQVLFLLLEME